MENILRNLVGPLVRRLGTAAAVLLVSHGYESGGVDAVINAFVGLILVSVDLVLSKFYRKAVEEETVNSHWRQFAETDKKSVDRFGSN